MDKPDFLIIGAAKSGTTSLYFYLQQHPWIFMPFNKEPFFFAFENQDMTRYRFDGNIKALKNAIVDLDDYQALFSSVPERIKCGEASTLYLYMPEAAGRIAHHLPSAKLIAVLRNPIDRAYSHFQHFRREGYEPIGEFSMAIRAESQRIEENWFPSYFYLDAGFYSRQIKRFYEFFPKSQLKIFLFEDLKDARKMVGEIFKFLDLEAIIPSDTTSRHNISGTVRYPDFYRRVKDSSRIKPFLRRLIPPSMWSRVKARWEQMVIDPAQPMSQEDRASLIEVYRQEIADLEKLLDRDLSAWLKRN